VYRYGEDGKPTCDAFVIAVAGLFARAFTLSNRLDANLVVLQVDPLAGRSVQLRWNLPLSK
jgi:hypothetical protein